MKIYRKDLYIIMAENNNSENKGILYFLIHATIVFLVFILLTIGLMGNKQGGADIARWGAQLVLYLFQYFVIIVIHKRDNVWYALAGATSIFIIVFIYEATYTY